MASRKDFESRTIAKKLACYLPAFYLLYYIICIIMVGSFKVDWHELGKYPFRIDKDEFCPKGYGGAALGAWLAMVITFTVSLGLTMAIVRATQRSWDYVFTTSIVHFVICCIVNQAFPTNWVWWITLLIANLLLAVASEFAIYYAIEGRDIKLDH